MDLVAPQRAQHVTAHPVGTLEICRGVTKVGDECTERDQGFLLQPPGELLPSTLVEVCPEAAAP